MTSQLVNDLSPVSLFGNARAFRTVNKQQGNSRTPTRFLPHRPPLYPVFPRWTALAFCELVAFLLLSIVCRLVYASNVGWHTQDISLRCLEQSRERKPETSSVIENFPGSEGENFDVSWGRVWVRWRILQRLQLERV